MATKQIHLIAIGGAIMHYLAIDLKKNGYQVTGSDDVIFDPAKSNLEKENLLPKKMGWNAEHIHANLDLIILGMHAKKNNPELQKALDLKIPVQSFPEFVFQQTRDKLRVVVSGSHGKTTITSMIMHMLKEQKIDFDYLVGAKLSGFERMVKISNAPIVVIEGDEYLSSALDRKSKFHWYKPSVLLLTGIAWDHMNVFPTFDSYLQTFEKLIADNIDAKVIYFQDDKHLQNMVAKNKNREKIAYQATHFEPLESGMKIESAVFPIFGDHNAANLSGALEVVNFLGVPKNKALSSMKNYRGASLRLQKIFVSENTLIFRDFAHAPSKVKASVHAVNQHFSSRKFLAVLELHTFSSLDPAFIVQYKDSLDLADEKIVFLDDQALHKKGKSTELHASFLMDIFGQDCQIIKKSSLLKQRVQAFTSSKSVTLLMSSGNFGGINWSH